MLKIFVHVLLVWSVNMLKQRFPASARPTVLYHASIFRAGQSLETRPNWTCTRQEHGNFVFAGADLDAAYLYTIKTNGCCCTGNTEDFGYVIFSNRKEFYEQNPKGFIYRLSSKTFERVPNRDGNGFTQEWISRVAVPINQADTIKVDGIDEVMSRGHQVFFLTRSLNDAEQKLIGGQTTSNDIAGLIKSGAVIWENNERKISPDSNLKNLITGQPMRPSKKVSAFRNSNHL